MKRQHPRPRYQHSSTAKYSPMERVIAVAVVDETDGGTSGDDFNSAQRPSAPATSRKSNPSVTDATVGVEERGASIDAFSSEHHKRKRFSLVESNKTKAEGVASKSTPNEQLKARIASEEKFTDSSEQLDLITIEDTNSSVPSNRATFGDSVASVRPSVEGSVDSVSPVGYSVDESTQVKANSVAAEDQRERSGTAGKMESVDREKGDYRLSIYIGDDASSVASSQDGVIDSGNMNHQRRSIPSSTTQRHEVVDGVSSTVVHVASYDTAPTIKVPTTTTDSRPVQAQNLTLPLDSHANNKRLNDGHADGLSPIPRSPSTSSSLGRRAENGSSTPRLRISTPKTSPVAGPAGANAHPGGAPSTNGATTAKTPVDPSEKKPEIRSGPSSRRTVVMIAGLFVVGLILILSGIIVLSVEEHVEFRITGGIFLGTGIVFFIICLVLQKKNVKKLVNELEKDLFFLNVTDNKIWNFIFHFDEQLAWS